MGTTSPRGAQFHWAVPPGPAGSVGEGPACPPVPWTCPAICTADPARPLCPPETPALSLQTDTTPTSDKALCVLQKSAWRGEEKQTWEPGLLLRWLDTPDLCDSEPVCLRVGRGSPCATARGTRVGAWVARTPRPGTAPSLKVKRSLTGVGLRGVPWALGRDRPSRGAGDTELPRVRAGPVPAETACPAPLSRTVPRDGRRSFRPCLPSSALVCLQPRPSSAPAPCTLHQQTLLLLLTRTVVFVGLFILLEFFFFLAVLQGLWELSSQARDETCFLNSKSRSPNHWTSRESPLCF